MNSDEIFRAGFLFLEKFLLKMKFAIDNSRSEIISSLPKLQEAEQGLFQIAHRWVRHRAIQSYPS